MEQVWRITVEIAHIRAAERGGPRYDPTMSDDQRRDFANLLLLCTAHHDHADEHPERVPVELLLRWKAQREADPYQALERLREVTPAGLRRLVAEGLQEHDAKVLDALARLEHSDQDAARLMRSLVDELTEAYSVQRRRMLDADLVYELKDAAHTLSKMNGTLGDFIEATRTLRRKFPRGDE
ncbi:hypothetical protein [Streptosporangium subroseum]|uniref:hypothetical protein n=1 Tax=Streptosporangium subroseum TaxID=106412 RepID=UPI00117F56D5|nr:hypothetical protein [Streptosporangium subroseum]